MRTKESLRNTVCNLMTYVAILLIGFISQRIFKDILGNQYLGLHNLFSNIMTMLGIVELGFGSAIIVNMYKPLAEKNIPQIQSLLQYYKKIYHFIAFLVAIIGIFLLPFINIFVGDANKFINFKLVFIFYLIDTIFSYLMAYKRSIIYADQKSYYTTIIHAALVIIMNLMQIIVLLKWHNYYLYLLLRVIFRGLENFFISKVADMKYPYIKQKNVNELDLNLKKDIKTKVKGLLFHKIATFLVSGSNSIIISMVPTLGLEWNGKYSNYMMIINQLHSIITQIFSAIRASVGNLLIEGNGENSYKVFRVLMLINNWILIFISICFYLISFPFIEIWMGKGFVFEPAVVLALTLDIYLQGMRLPYMTFKEAAGIFYEDRYVPILESFVNLIVSIILAYYYGIIGVIIGTIVSNMVLYLYSFPKFVYKKIFGKGYLEYIQLLMKNITSFILIFIISHIIADFKKFDSVYLNLIWVTLVGCIIPNVILIILNRKRFEFQYVLEKIKMRRKC